MEYSKNARLHRKSQRKGQSTLPVQGDHAPSHYSENSETGATLSYAGNATVC